ncbi:MAG: DUF2339 domain-containing protein [Candidatus Omnitrophota bacterium]
MNEFKKEIDKIKQELLKLTARLNNLEATFGVKEPEKSPSKTQPEAKILAPKIILEEEVATHPKIDIELKFGKFWLNKIGIVIFAMGIAFLITYTFKYFGPFIKILFGYLIGGALFYFGTKIEKNEKFKNYGHVLLGGGWAIIYFTTYAMHHFEASRILTSKLIDIFFLTLVALGIIKYSLKYKSEELTSITLIIGYITAILGNIGYFTLVNSLILAIIAIILVYKFKWTRTIFLGIISTYLLHVIWLQDKVNYSFILNAGFLCIYWLLFTTSIHLIKSNEKNIFNKLAIANFMNFILFFFMFYPKFIKFHPINKFDFIFALGIIYSSIALIVRKTNNTKLFSSNIIIAVSLLTLAIPLKFMPFHARIIWSIELPFLLLCGIIFNLPIFRYLAFALMFFNLFDFLNQTSYIGFLSFLGFVSTALCYLVHKNQRNKQALSFSEVKIVQNFYSAVSIIYLIFLSCKNLPQEWATLGLTVEYLFIFICGYMLLDKYLRIYSLILLANLIIPLLEFHELYMNNPKIMFFLLNSNVLTTILAIISTSIIYFLYKRLNKRALLDSREQWLVNSVFFTALLLLIILIFRFVMDSWISVVLGLSGIMAISIGLIFKDKLFRLGGFIIFFITLTRIAFFDLAGLTIIYKIISFIILGVIFLAVSFIYTKYNIPKLEKK